MWQVRGGWVWQVRGWLGVAGEGWGWQVRVGWVWQVRGGGGR